MRVLYLIIIYHVAEMGENTKIRPEADICIKGNLFILLDRTKV